MTDDHELLSRLRHAWECELTAGIRLERHDRDAARNVDACRQRRQHDRCWSRSDQICRRRQRTRRGSRQYGAAHNCRCRETLGLQLRRKRRDVQAESRRRQSSITGCAHRGNIWRSLSTLLQHMSESGATQGRWHGGYPPGSTANADALAPSPRHDARTLSAVRAAGR